MIIGEAVRSFLCGICGEAVTQGEMYGIVESRLACEYCAETESDLLSIYREEMSDDVD